MVRPEEILALVVEYGRQRFHHGTSNLRAERNRSTRARKLNRKKANAAMHESERLYREIESRLKVTE